MIKSVAAESWPILVFKSSTKESIKVVNQPANICRDARVDKMSSRSVWVRLGVNKSASTNLHLT